MFDPDFASPGDWASFYRSLGIQVVPCLVPVRGLKVWKRPALTEWKTFQQELVPDETFKRWYAPGGEFARCGNMGFLCGPCSGNLVCVDLDEHKNPASREWWRAGVEVHNNGIEPETWQQRTGGGGRQLFFRAPAGWTAPTCRTERGVDIRGQGGFAVVPPSLHESGSNYGWVQGFAPWECELADAPEWLLREIEKLVAEHGGASRGAAIMRTPSPDTDLNVFGLHIDGREDFMTRCVWASMVDLYRQSPIRPAGSAPMMAAYESYHRKVKPRVEGTNKFEALESEGRGLTMFGEKWVRALSKWDTEIKAAAAVPPPPKDDVVQVSVQPPPPPSIIQATPFVCVAPSRIPPREWIYGRHYIRRFLSTTVAPGGVGKSSLIIGEALAIVSGRHILGVEPVERTNVWIWNGEDPDEELERRIMAAIEYFKIPWTEVQGRLFVDSGRKMPIVVAHKTKDGVVINVPIVDQVIHTIKANNIGVFNVDPFITSHRVTENDNSEIERVAKTWAHIADECRCSVELVHHVRKTGGAEIGVEDGRGAVALLAAARAARALNPMTKEEGARAGVENHRLYFRGDDGKANLAPPSDRADWFRLASFDLGNQTETRVSDRVGVVESWTWPDHAEGVTGSDVEEVRRRLAVRPNYYRKSDRSPEWIGYLILEVLGLKPDAAGKAKARALQTMWEETRALVEVEGKDAQRHTRKFVVPGGN